MEEWQPTGICMILAGAEVVKRRGRGITVGFLFLFFTFNGLASALFWETWPELPPDSGSVSFCHTVLLKLQVRWHWPKMGMLVLHQWQEPSLAIQWLIKNFLLSLNPLSFSLYPETIIFKLVLEWWQNIRQGKQGRYRRNFVFLSLQLNCLVTIRKKFELIRFWRNSLGEQQSIYQWDHT